MKTYCSECRKSFNISEEQIFDFNTGILISCPECSADIKIEINTIQNAVKESGKNLLFGDKLKKAILASVESLPPMPQVAVKARKILSAPDSGFSELAGVIETDQAITATVLKIANSAYYGVMNRVSTVQQAGVIMGTKTLMEILTLACASSLLGNRLTGYDLDSGDMWLHSLSTASCSRIIAKKFRPELEGDAFTAGLLHDCGKLILDPYVQERKSEFLNLLEENRISFDDAENHILGFDHGAIASEVCIKWKIPDNIAHAIRYHHNPTESPEKDLTYIVHVSDAIAMISGIGIGFDGMLYEIDESIIKYLDISGAAINSIICEAVEDVEKMTEKN